MARKRTPRCRCQFLQDIGIDASGSSEQVNRGSHSHRKVEANSDVGFAVVLLTPDDMGVSRPGTEPRPRQNVVRARYFLGKLGRAKGLRPQRGNMEIPSELRASCGSRWTTRGWKLAARAKN